MTVQTAGSSDSALSGGMGRAVCGWETPLAPDNVTHILWTTPDRRAVL